MVKTIYKKYIGFFFTAILLLIYLFKINNYLLSDFFAESKFIAISTNMHSLKSLFLPVFDGEIYSGAGIIYYLMIKLSTFLFSGYSEFSVRFPSVFISFFTLITSYFLIKRAINRNFAIITSLALFANAIFIIYSTISSPIMISSCFILISVLFGIINIFIERIEYKKYYYYAFWIFSLLAGLTGNLSNMTLPFLIVLPTIIITKKTNEFILPINFFPGFIGTITALSLYIFIGSYFFNSDFTYFLYNSFFAKTDIIRNYTYYLKNYLIYFAAGCLPWIFSLVSIIIATIIKLFKKSNNTSKDIFFQSFNQEKKFFLITIWGISCSLVYYFLLQTNDLTGILCSIFFVSLFVSCYWYDNIFNNLNQKTIYIPSLIFYISIILVAAILVFAFFTVNPLQKIYIEPLVIPSMVISLFVVIPGLIALALKRRLLNFGIHILFSYLFFLLTTSLLYNYINSFGENDLVNFAIKAKQDDAILVTYNIKNKYSMNYYYGKPVVFNNILNAENIYNNYGDTRNVYIVTKHTDLAYFDKFFVYEIVANGKQYCEITNIKYLPIDEVNLNTSESQES